MKTAKKFESQKNISDLLPCSEKVLTMDGPKDGCYIIVVNRQQEFGPSIRHVITNTAAETLDEFKQWYYSEYSELEGDEFIVCATREDRDEMIKSERYC